jgi:hypothetical protein
MTQRDPGVYLEDVEYYASAAVRFMSGYSLEQYLYAELDHNKVYDVAVKHAPELLDAVRKALKAFPDPAP